MTNRHQNYFISFGEFHSKTLNGLILMCSLICYNKIYSFLDRYSEYSLYWIIFNLKSKNKNQPLKTLLTALLTYTIDSEMISIQHHYHPASLKEETWSENALKSPRYFFKQPQSFNNQVFLVSIKWYFHSSICSGQNTIIFLDSFSFYQTPYPIHQGIPLAIPSKDTLSLTSSKNLWCYHSIPSHHHLCFGLLQ